MPSQVPLTEVEVALPPRHICAACALPGGRVLVPAVEGGDWLVVDGVAGNS